MSNSVPSVWFPASKPATPRRFAHDCWMIASPPVFCCMKNGNTYDAYILRPAPDRCSEDLIFWYVSVKRGCTALSVDSRAKSVSAQTADASVYQYSLLPFAPGVKAIFWL